MKFALAWFGLVNLLAFLAYGLDKRAARRGGRRVPEARLLALALLGGVPGSWLGMRTFRHKTRKRSFRLRFAGTVIWNVVGGAAWWWFRAGPGSPH